MKKISIVKSTLFSIIVLTSACAEQKADEQDDKKQTENNQQEKVVEKQPKINPDNIGDFIFDIDDLLNTVYQWENKKVTLVGSPTSSIVRKDSVHFNFGWVGLTSKNRELNSKSSKLIEVPFKDLNYENRPIATNEFIVTTGIIKSINCYGENPCFILFEPDTIYIANKKPNTDDLVNGFIEENKTYDVEVFYNEVLKYNNKQVIVSGRPTNYNVSKTIEGEFKSCNIVIKNDQGSRLTCYFDEPQNEYVKPDGPKGGFASSLTVKGTIELKRYMGMRANSLSNCSVIVD